MIYYLKRMNIPLPVNNQRLIGLTTPDQDHQGNERQPDDHFFPVIRAEKLFYIVNVHRNNRYNEGHHCDNPVTLRPRCINRYGRNQIQSHQIQQKFIARKAVTLFILISTVSINKIIKSKNGIRKKTAAGTQPTVAFPVISIVRPSR